MKILLVYAHPEPRSFNGAMRDVALDTLREAGHEVRVSDLYAMRFDPVGGAHDFAEVQDPAFFKYQREQRHAAATGTFAADVAAEVEKVVWADLVLLQFPLWWFSLPAILKGWVDRVFAMGFAYDIGRTHEAGPLAGKRAMIAVTTGSPAITYGPSGRNGDLEHLLVHVQHGMLHYAGMEVLPPFVVYGAARITDEERREHLEAYRARLLGLERAEPMRFARMRDTDPAPAPPAVSVRSSAIDPASPATAAQASAAQASAAQATGAQASGTD